MAEFYPISYSTLSMYESCPYKFYRMKVHSPKVKPDLDNKALKRGNDVHKVLEDFISKNTPIPSAYNNLARISKALNKLKNIPNIKLTTEQGYYIARDGRVLKDGNFFTNFKNCWFNARVDLTISYNDVALIKDYKTGKSDGDIFQLDLQAACVFIGNPSVNTVKSQFLYVDKNVASEEKIHTRSNFWTDEIKSRFLSYEQGLALNKFNRQPTDLGCRFCPVTDCIYNRNKELKEKINHDTRK